jgi:hypothetical protein
MTPHNENSPSTVLHVTLMACTDIQKCRFCQITIIFTFDKSAIILYLHVIKLISIHGSRVRLILSLQAVLLNTAQHVFTNQVLTAFPVLITKTNLNPCMEAVAGFFFDLTYGQEEKMVNFENDNHTNKSTRILALTGVGNWLNFPWELINRL